MIDPRTLCKLLLLSLSLALGTPCLSACQTPRAAVLQPDGLAAANSLGQSGGDVCCYYLKTVETPGREDECGELCDITQLGPTQSCPENRSCGVTVDKTLCFQQPAVDEGCPALDEEQIALCLQGTICEPKKEE